MVVLDATVVNVALPSIHQALDFSTADLQWIVNGYTLVFGGFLLLGGRASDLLGRRHLFIAGVVIFTIASAINGIADSSGVLIAGRALQGLGGAFVSPAALAILTTSFEEGAERTKALGVWSAIAAGGAAFGLIIGGALTEWLSWRWVFFVNLPIGVGATIAALRLLPQLRAPPRPGTHGGGGAGPRPGGPPLLLVAVLQGAGVGRGTGEGV